MKKELSEKLKCKREIEDWLDEKVQIEFQQESGRARVRALNDELITNSKAFDREKYTLQTLIKKKNMIMDRVSGGNFIGLDKNGGALNAGGEVGLGDDQEERKQDPNSQASQNAMSDGY